LKLAVWSPLPPAPSGIADYVAEQLDVLGTLAEIEAVVEEPDSVDPELRRRFRLRRPEAEGAPSALDVYHLGNSPAHAYVHRAAIRRPGVAVLHDWSLHHLVLKETLERGDRAAYLREMRRSYGETGSFVGRQVASALGGDLLPAMFPLNERVLERSLAIVGLTRAVAERARRGLPAGRPVLRLPHHLSLPLTPLPSRAEARRALGLPSDALLVTAPGLATVSKRLDAALDAMVRLAPRFPSLRLVIAGGVDPRLPLLEWARARGIAERTLVTGRLSLADFVRHLCASDVVLALRFPSHGEISGALVRALGVGRPALVTAGTPPAEEFPEGLVVPVDPGRAEVDELFALLARLLGDREMREAIGRLAAAHLHVEHEIQSTTRRLAAFLEEVIGRRDELWREIEAARPAEGSLAEYLQQEVRWSAFELGLAGQHLNVDPLLAELMGEEK